MAVAGISFEVDGNTNPATKAIDQLGQRIQKLASTWDVAFDEINASTTSSYQNMAKAGEAMREFGNSATRGFTQASNAAGNFDRSTENIGKGADRAQRAFQGAATNISAQFQDITVQAQMGASSMAIALQQGTQLGAVLSSSAGGVKALASAFFSLLSPANLLGIAIAFAGAELVKFFVGMFKAGEVKKTEDVLKDTATMFKEIGDAVPGVTTAIGNYQKATMSMLRGDALVKQIDLTRSLADETKKAFDTILNMPVPDFKGEQYGVALQALQRLSDSAKTGTPDLEAFHAQIDLITGSGSAFSEAQKDAARNLDYMVTEVMKANAQFPPLQAAMISFFNSVAQGTPDIAGLVATLDSISRNTGDKALKDIVDTLSNKLRGASNVQQALAAVNETIDLLAGKTEVLTAIELKAKAAKEALAKQTHDYAAALEGMAGVVPKVQQSEQQRLDTLYATALATAADSDAVNAATAAYTAGTTALQQYNVTLAARLLTGQAQLDLEHTLAQAHTDGTLALAGLNAEYAKQSAQLQADQTMQGLVTALQQVQATAPQVTLTLQQQLDQWYEQQKAVGLTTDQLRDLDAEYISLGNSIQTAVSKASLSTQFAQLASTAFSSLNTVIRDYAAQVEAGTMTGEQFVWHLQQIAQNAPTEELRQAAAQTAALAQQALSAQGPIAGMGNTASVSAGQLLQMGNAAQIAGSQLGALLQLSAQTSAAISAGTSAAQTLADAAITKPIFKNALERTIAGYKDLRDVAIKGALATHNTAAEMKAQADFIAASAEATRQFNAAEAMKPGKMGGGGAKGPDPDKVQVGEFGGKDMNLDQLKQWIFAQQSAIDPTIKLREEQDKLQLAIAKGMVTQSEAEAINKHLQEQYGKTTAATFDFAKTFQQMMDSWGQSVASSLADAIVNGEDLNQVFQDLIKQLIKMALQMLVLEPLMKSITSGMSGWFSGTPAPAAAVPAAMAAANQNLLRGLPPAGSVGGRNAMVSGGGGTFNSSVGAITINMGGGKDGGVETMGGKNAQAFGSRIRDLIQNEMTRQSRPGGLLWAGGRR